MQKLLFRKINTAFGLYYCRSSFENSVSLQDGIMEVTNGITILFMGDNNFVNAIKSNIVSQQQLKSQFEKA